METRIDNKRVESLAGTLGFDHVYAIDSQGSSGGIGIFWKNTIKLEILGSSVYHIDCSVTEESSEAWRLTCIYGEAQTNLRYKTWDMMRDIADHSSLPWLCIGDFNEVLRLDEQEGLGERSNAQIQAFRGAVDACMLMDIGYTGQFWTYEKKARGGTYTRVRLDRALGSGEWCRKFPLASLSHETTSCSDHKPVLLLLEGATGKNTRRKRFMYETMWGSHENWKDVILTQWSATPSASSMDELKQKMANISRGLTQWIKSSFGSVRKEIHG